ncbi:hypothetical protein [Halalkalibacterium halodurans]|uniref:hypothetical protein n=1 Tax=Halalkalibacterium halodurans TaxID=86665 RepID=UPI002AA96E07|nr:hypothetical protein [Halalkalibacterium halodurans]MDY7222102.1 hypothetical protein [Halalkalibacterium halodurans]MDY7243879.1 hypothetical protein [Halalkalibacterium halodurans]
MNPTTIVLTPDQLSELKNELLKEIKREVSPQVKSSPYPLTTKIRELAGPTLGQDYQFVQAFSTIARKTLDFRHQAVLNDEKLESAMKMVEELMVVIEKYRQKQLSD